MYQHGDQKLRSEHEDDCCVTVELSMPAAAKQSEIEGSFLSAAKGSVSKGSRPDRLRFAKIPRNFKGAILVPDLKKDCEAAFVRS